MLISFFLITAIVGGGVGGTSTAYFLGELLDKKAPNLNYEIDIFEQSSKIGGRVATIRFEDTEFEAGGSILHERNRYAAMFLRKFGKTWNFVSTLSVDHILCLLVSFRT